jgi:hypothetical protein
VTHALRRFASQITRVEVHVADVNAGKQGSADKRCMMEARPAGRQRGRRPDLVRTQAGWRLGRH